MIEKAIEGWHEVLSCRDAGERNGLLDALLADDVVFYSPVVFTPQRGKTVTKLYLAAAGATFEGDEGAAEETGDSSSGSGGFRYVTKVLSGDTAVLEFETSMGGKYVNGVDIIRCNEQGQIVEFKVMIRPLQAIQAMHAAMGAMLAKMQKGADAA